MKWANEERWDSYIESAAEQFGVPSDLIRAIIAQESGFSPNASRKETAIGDQSSGLMQILYSTAKGEGYSGEIGDPRMLSGLFDPETNIYYGTSYLASQIDQANGSVPGAISAYNGGWRPSLGFGQPATKPLTICLAKDATGKCIQTRSVPVGQYSNQPYVNAVLNNYVYFQNKTTVSQSQPIDTGDNTPSPLVRAGISKPKVTRPDSSVSDRATRNTFWQTASRILKWLFRIR